MDRRRFIFTASAGPALLVWGCHRRRPPVARSDGPPDPRLRTAQTARSLTPDQWQLVEASTARLVPSEPDSPGAREAGVVRYIDEQLTLDHFAWVKKLFAAGLRKMDQLSQQMHGKPFSSASDPQQDAVLKRLERGVPLGRRHNSRKFFVVLLTLTLEGLLGDPIYGGNANKVGWTLIGFEPRPPRPRVPYRSPV